MSLVDQTLKLEITPGGVPPKLHVTEYDENMQVVAQLFQRGQYYEIPSGTTAKVEGTLAGHPFSADATVDGSNVTFELTKGMTAYAGRAWTKIKLTQNSKPVSTCGFWLECDRAGVEAGDVIGAPGFDEQISAAVNAYLDANPVSGGISTTAKNLLITILRSGVYTDDQSANITALEAALGGSGESGGETEKTLISISATYSGGDVAVGTAITDLTGIVVTATYSDGSTATVTDYTMSGEIAEGENTITVTYDGMTTTFTVTGIAESSGGEEVSIDIQSLLTASGYYFDGYPDIVNKERHKGTSLDGGTTPAYAIELVPGATYTLKTAFDGDKTAIYGPAAFSGSTDGSAAGAWRGNIHKYSEIEKTSEEISSGVYLLTYTFTAPTGTVYLSAGCLNGYVSYASLSYQQG